MEGRKSKGRFGGIKEVVNVFHDGRQSDNGVRSSSSGFVVGICSGVLFVVVLVTVVVVVIVAVAVADVVAVVMVIVPMVAVVMMGKCYVCLDQYWYYQH